VPQTLEAPAAPARREASSTTPKLERKAELVELDLKQRNNIMLQLIHENIQLRKSMHAMPLPAPATDEASAGTKARQWRFRRKGK
jgi:hypothetical protein